MLHDPVPQNTDGPEVRSFQGIYRFCFVEVQGDGGPGTRRYVQATPPHRGGIAGRRPRNVYDRCGTLVSILEGSANTWDSEYPYLGANLRGRVIATWALTGCGRVSFRLWWRQVGQTSGFGTVRDSLAPLRIRALKCPQSAAVPVLRVRLSLAGISARSATRGSCCCASAAALDHITRDVGNVGASSRLFFSGSAPFLNIPAIEARRDCDAQRPAHGRVAAAMCGVVFLPDRRGIATRGRPDVCRTFYTSRRAWSRFSRERYRFDGERHRAPRA